MTKKDLKTGMWVQRRDGSYRMLLLGTEHGDFVVGESYAGLSFIKDDLTSKTSKNLDFMKVYQPRTNIAYLPDSDGKPKLHEMRLLWERPAEVKEISKDEAFRILKDKFGCDVKITE
jgi:hypothetical protein